MKGFDIEITETLSRIVHVEVESDSPYEAMDNVMIRYYDCDIVLTSEDLSDINFRLIVQ